MLDPTILIERGAKDDWGDKIFIEVSQIATITISASSIALHSMLKEHMFSL